MAEPPAGRYKRYKAGTLKVRNWLCLTAHGSIDTAHDNNATTHVSTRMFILLATRIVKSQELSAQVKVADLAEILSVLDEVIQLRQEFLEDSIRKRIASVRESIGGHRFFINILKNVRAILLTIKENEVVDSKDLEDPSARTTANVFSCIFPRFEDQEPQDEPEGGALNVAWADIRPAQTMHEEEAEEELLESEFVMWCSLRDAEDISLVASDTWEVGSSGQFRTAANHIQL